MAFRSADASGGQRLRSLIGAWAALLVLLATLPGHAMGPARDGGVSVEQTIRPLHPLVSRILKEGREMSPTFAALSERVAASRSVIVYVDVRMDSTDSGLNGALHFMASGSGHGFLRIDLHTGSTAWPSDIRALIIVLAHELWHASEVASHDVTTLEGFRRLYQSIGNETHREVFETPEARAVSEAVRREIYGMDRTGQSGEWPVSPARPRM